MGKPCIQIFKIRVFLFAFFLISTTFSVAYGSRYNYAVVVSSSAYSDPGWKAVADSLLKKHGKNGTAVLFTWSSSVNEIKSSLSEFKPDYIAYIVRPATECNSAFVVAVSRLSRQLDNDPYGDAVWGIVTGYESSDALRAISESLTVKTVLAASSNLSYEPPIRRFYQAIGMTCDSYTKTDYLFPDSQGKVYTENKRPENEQDRIKLVSKWLNAQSLNIEIPGQGKLNGPVDCFITGGHGNVNLWQCHYPEAGTEGYMQSSGGKLYGAPYSGSSIAITAPTPKIFWCASNCLMGNPDKKDNVVYAAFGTGHAVQMFGFVNNSSSGNDFMAWGVYDRVTKSAGVYTLPRGFFLSNNNSLFELKHPSGEMDTKLVEQFTDSTVIYGDPAGDVKFYDFGDSARAYKTDLSFVPDDSGVAEFTYTLTMLAHDLEFGAGYCYQFRPISLLPVRIDPATVVITKNEGHTAEITDNLLIWEMLSKGEKLSRGKTKILRWTAKITDEKNVSVKDKHVSIETRPCMRVIPAPAGVIMHVMNMPSGKFNIRIVDLAGRLCYSGKFISNGMIKQSFNAGYTSGSGVYFLTLIQGRITMTSMIHG